MTDKIQLINEGTCQILCLPDGYRFNCSEVFIRRDRDTGDVILSCMQMSWTEFLDEDVAGTVPGDFMTSTDRRQGTHDRDPFLGIEI